MKKILASELQLLREIVSRRMPQAVGVVERVGVRPLTTDERDMLQEALAGEFVDTGLTSEDEPNARGRTIDALISRLGRF